MLTILQLPVLTDNYIYLLHDPLSGQTAAIDPSLADPVLSCLQQQGWQLDYILNTHHHHDHVGGNQTLKQHTGCRIIGAAHDAARIPEIDQGVQAGDSVFLGDYALRVLDCPGHTLGHLAFYSAEADALFCGDTLFALGCGRLFEGTAAQMQASLDQFCQLPANTRVYCAHEYTLANAQFALSVEPHNLALQDFYAQAQQLRAQQQATVPTTLAQERALNPFLRTDSAAIRAQLQLPDASRLAVFSELRERKNHFY